MSNTTKAMLYVKIAEDKWAEKLKDGCAWFGTINGYIKKAEEEHNEILDTISKKYQRQTEATYAAARLWTDAIINPADTRKWISMGIEAANHSPIEKQFNLGVIQV